MNTIRLKQYVGNDGMLKLEVPAGIAQRTMDVLVVMQPVDAAEGEVDALGWPVGFFERTYGSLADDPIERGEQPPLDVRDEIE
jgi:hypothetical protein